MIIRFERNGKVKHGWMVEADNKVRVIEGDIYKIQTAKPIMTGLELPLDEVALQAPSAPSKVVCIGVNYPDHASEMDIELPKEPLMFLKPSTTVIGPGEPIVYPKLTKNLHYEGELAIVIKKQAKKVKAEDAEDYILGFTCAIDVTARDLQMSDGQWTRAKGFDTFCPLGPAIAAKLDYNDLRIVTRVNGEVRQNASTSQMVFSIPQLVEAVSAVMTLLPGDVILTGTPAGVGELHPGDEISVTIEEIGTLATRVVMEE
ncbi:fumarylacetoacetate hydrolase family protein [Brevibacillus choshinensis]|uniref:fumarylacetoacetate hydrolase family protein n=1 Tax=Brevibacillus choshinensis TaxID=54911 RepID=UPI002E24C324|nr:fumarylacetoacetate hydrolase family protein [Brevibacillus choshinensis]MED4753152.1 fumarylacetoacetate hydrolase family protein [Brevibacillus choshinensis]MED4781269.1 fumarylacetoacetate hydrolase family protein [Brevibacillus choshinensis]